MSLSANNETGMDNMVGKKVESHSPLANESVITTEGHSASDPFPITNKNVLENKTFHCFPKCPIQIRKIIWEMALPGNRIVGVRLANNNSKPVVGDRITLWNQPSALFYVNQESRQLALAKYNIQLSSSTINACRSRIDPEKDTVLIQYYQTEGDNYSHTILNTLLWSAQAKAKLSDIVLDSRMIRPGLIASNTTTEQRREMLQDFAHRKELVYSNLMQFSALKELYIIYHHRHCVTTPTKAMWSSKIKFTRALGRRTQMNDVRDRINYDIQQVSFQNPNITNWQRLPVIHFGHLKVGSEKCCNIVGKMEDAADAWDSGLIGDSLDWEDDKLLRKGMEDYVAPKELRKR